MTEIQYQLFSLIRNHIIGVESNDTGWIIFLDIIKDLPDDVAEEIYNDIIENGTIYKLEDDFPINVEESLHKYMEAFNKLNEDILNEFKIKSQKERRLLAIKRKLLKKLGDRAKSLSFKRNYVFSSKLKRFVRRKKPLSMQTLRKKAKLMKKLHRKSSFNRKAARARKFYKNRKINV